MSNNIVHAVSGKGNVVLYFYPKDETPGCTAEACAFRDEWDEFEKMNAKVMGISSDSPESHRKFKEHRKLPFMLISDPGQKIREIVKGKFVVQCFDIKDKRISYIYSSQKKPSILVFDGKEYDPNSKMSGEAAEEMKVGEVEGWCMIGGKNSPNLVFVHGGPHDAYGESYMIEFQYFLINGYNILFCNPRGSSSYGSEFAAACVGDWGNGPAEDIFNFIEAAKKYIISVS